MHKNYSILLFCLFGVFNSVNAQEKLVKINPLALLDPLNPKLQIAYERITADDLGIEIEAGRFFNTNLDQNRTDKRGWVGSFELRHYRYFRPKRRYYLKPRYLSRTFFAIEYQFIHRFYTLLEDPDVRSPLDIAITKKIHRLALKMGTVDSFLSGLNLDWSISVGIAQVRTIHKSGNIFIDRGPSFIFTTERAGSSFVPYFGIGFRISKAIEKSPVLKSLIKG